jgi:hypothetical protein
MEKTSNYKKIGKCYPKDNVDWLMVRFIRPGTSTTSLEKLRVVDESEEEVDILLDDKPEIVKEV